MNTDRTSDTWEGCPPGELKQMVGQIRLDERRRFLRQVAKGSAAVILLGAGGVVASQWLLKDRMDRFGGLACSRVMELLPTYKGRQLEDDLMRRVAIHLENCPKCEAHYQGMT